MNKFQKPYGDRPRNGGRFNRNDRGASRGSRFDKPMQKFDAVCSKCGKACQVPFRPNGTRPVFCADCFGGPHNIARDKKFAMRDGSPWPTAQSPESPRAGGKTIADLERQIGAMNTKIDTMLRILESVSAEAQDDEEDEEELPEVTPPPRKRSPRPRV